MEGMASNRSGYRRGDSSKEPLGMWTAGFCVDRPEGLMAAFAAVIAPDRECACRAIALAFGTEIDQSRVSAGFDAADPYAELLVSARLAEEITAVASSARLKACRSYQIRLERTFH